MGSCRLLQKLNSCGGKLEEICEFQSKRVEIRLLAVAEGRDEGGDVVVTDVSLASQGLGARLVGFGLGARLVGFSLGEQLGSPIA
ncbi:glucose-6-phosphate/phosphate translocator 1 [Pyrus ussuriensis x Pyrus communis]|uniref:Glucose-6-phosphate/phosphate translocator 1 n=1 Tax=Pyrus ussuriensis x Pyrus communis TaxID=2448454 RepID=A0A5N5HS23_9ROSA|nr:glucose-6-phosphate/phosphate translocator 1 [Pyrus ussuriensis x Pyrus communis]